MTLHVGGRSVRQDGQLVATLSYAGPLITVHRPDGTIPGRLVRHVHDVEEACYDAWTAKHPAAPVPADYVMGAGLPIEDAVALVLTEPVRVL